MYLGNTQLTQEAGPCAAFKFSERVVVLGRPVGENLQRHGLG